MFENLKIKIQHNVRMIVDDEYASVFIDAVLIERELEREILAMNKA